MQQPCGRIDEELVAPKLPRRACREVDIFQHEKTILCIELHLLENLAPISGNPPVQEVRLNQLPFPLARVSMDINAPIVKYTPVEQVKHCAIATRPARHLQY